MSMSPRETLSSGAAKMGISLTERQLDQFEAFTELLLEWNRRFNLTRITDPVEIAIKHYLDSLSLVAAVGLTNELTIDVGTGAGLPGVPLKIAVPGLRMTLTDSVRKKLLFVEAAVAALGMRDVEIVHARAEELGRERAYRERFDLSVSRAVAKLAVLAEYCLPLCRVGGVFAAYKGPEAEEELAEAEHAIRTLGGRLEKLHRLVLPHSDVRRTLVVTRKERPTPPRFPRKAGTPARSPLAPGKGEGTVLPILKTLRKTSPATRRLTACRDFEGS